MQNEPRVLQPSDLEPGDILYFRPLSPSAIEQRVARKSRSPYTHTAIYLGEGNIAHALEPQVAIEPLSQYLTGDYVFGVFRSQMGFGPERVKKLRDFIQSLIQKNAKYDTEGKGTFFKSRDSFIDNPFDYYLRHQDEVASREDFERGAYFCSGLVVACFVVTGIIADSAQAAYPNRFLAPVDLYIEPTFGWFVGYVLPNGSVIPNGDPLQHQTLWSSP